MMTNTVEEVIPEVEPQYPKLSRLLHKVFEECVAAIKAFPS